jgi:hypothetical protein
MLEKAFRILDLVLLISRNGTIESERFVVNKIESSLHAAAMRLRFTAYMSWVGNLTRFKW